MIKCVIWDIDNTLLDGTFLESERPPPDAELVAVVRELAGRGILQALASRNPPSAADYVTGLTGISFAAAECGWQEKSAAIRRILDALDIAPDATAFVDDDPFERAEVSAGLPGLLVLSPEDAAQAPTWPAFSPVVLTEEGRRRAENYAHRRAREAAFRERGGSRADFIRWAGTRVTITPAGPGDSARLHELAVRTHQFNSSGEQLSADEFSALARSPGHRVVAVRLSDRFGDDGIVGGAVVESPPGRPAERVRLLMVSCRALGRGVAEAVLAWLCQAAAAAGARQVRVPVLATERNVPLRMALMAAGFQAEQARADRVSFVRTLTGRLPELPTWVRPEPPETAIIAELRGCLARLTGDQALLAVASDVPLFGSGIGLDSLTGTLLLREVHRRYGVDVAAADLNLDSLESLDTLAAFVAGHLGEHGCGEGMSQ